MKEHDSALEVSSLSLDQKASLTSGADFWTTKRLPDAGIPSIPLTDGVALGAEAAAQDVGVLLGPGARPRPRRGGSVSSCVRRARPSHADVFVPLSLSTVIDSALTEEGIRRTLSAVPPREQP